MKHISASTVLYLTVAVLLFGLDACTSTPLSTDSREVRLDESIHSGAELDVESIMRLAEDEVKTELPKGRLITVTFQGASGVLRELQGEIHLTFQERRWIFPKIRTLVGLVSIDTTEGILRLSTVDYSEHPLLTNPIDVSSGLSLTEVASLAYGYIRESIGDGCDVTLTRLDDTWYVICTPSGSGATGHRLCAFELDAATGQLVEDLSKAQE